MNIQAIIASLVLGSSLASSSVALADPYEQPAPFVDRDDRYDRDERNDHRDDRYDPRGDRYDHRGGWASKDFVPPGYRRVVLASGLSFGRDGREFINVGRDHGQFRSIQINAAGGRTFIKQVYVQFGNGEEQVMRDLDATLTGRETLRLDLNGGRRFIRRIVVYGTDINGGWRRHDAAFTVTAV